MVGPTSSTTESGACRSRPGRTRLPSILVTVIVRSGTNGWGEEEIRWAMGWRYSNHNSDAFDRDLIVVTPHGWCSLWSESGGHTPAMVPS